MSTNDAFIKAYRHDAARTTPPAPLQQPAVATRPAAVAAISTIDRRLPVADRARSTTSWQTTVEFVTPIYDASTYAEVLSVLPPIALPTNSLPPLSSAIERPPSSSAVSRREPSIGKRPLSSFIAPESLPTTPVQKSFHPETTIPSFRWPSVCRTLWQECAPQYERVADVLAVHARNAGQGGVIIGVAGLQSGDGCTTTLLCLAIALATRNLRPILVDANFESPQLANRLGVQSSATWDDVLELDATIDEAVICAARDGIDLLPLAPRDTNAERRSSSHFAAGIQSSVTADALRDSYDIALVDLGPLLVPATFATISQLLHQMSIQAAVIVTDPKNTTQDDLTVAGELLEEDGCQLLGIIENRSNVSRKDAKGQRSQRKT